MGGWKRIYIEEETVAEGTAEEGSVGDGIFGECPVGESTLFFYRRRIYSTFQNPVDF